MRRFLGRKIALFIFCFIRLASADEGSLQVEILQQKFKNFEYDSVITSANKFLQQRGQFSTANLIKIYQMKAIAHYSLRSMNDALNSFIEILKLDPDYSLDPVLTSPKIIDFFNNEVKSNFQQTPLQIKEHAVLKDTVRVFIDNARLIRGSVVRSLVLPGWGHLHMGRKAKGLFLTAASATAIGFIAKYAMDADEKEKLYLQQTRPDLIKQKYQEYNKSYKTRNYLLIAFSAVWVYAQMDLLFVQKFDSEAGKMSLQPLLNLESHPQIGFSLSF